MREEQFLTHSEASITLIPNSDKDIIKKKKIYTAISLMNTDVKILSK